MDVRNCRQCGKLFNYIGGPYRTLCPECIQNLEDKFAEVKEYIRDNVQAGIAEVSQACDVSSKQIEQWVREERLCFADDSPVGLACECCGATIKTGRYCENCKSTMANQLDNLYQKKASAAPKRETRENARMRFLDKG